MTIPFGATRHLWRTVATPNATSETVAELAASPDHVRLCGPRGELEAIARAIHVLGPRASQQLVWLVCDELPESLIWSELFGHRAGAFPGAFRDYRGQICRAHGGTLVIVGAEHLSPKLQTMLEAHAITGEVWPLGSVVPAGRVDVRLVELFTD